MFNDISAPLNKIIIFFFFLNKNKNILAFGYEPEGTGKEGNVLFNDAFNTFYFMVLWRITYGKWPLRL